VKPVAVIFTILLMFAIGQLVNFMQAGQPTGANLKSVADHKISGVPAEGDHHQRPHRAREE
jgi:hypothetical protein